MSEDKKVLDLIWMFGIHMSNPENVQHVFDCIKCQQDFTNIINHLSEGIFQND